MHRLAAGLILGLAAGCPAGAHHSLSNYDHGRQSTIEGVIVEFRFVNPHAFLMVESGGRTWRVEMDDRNELADAGVTEETLKPKDRVEVTGRPDRSGEHALYLARLERTDGLVLQQVGSSPRLTPAPR